MSRAGAAALRSRLLRRWRQALARLLRRRMVNRHGVPGRRHPDSMTRELPALDEEWLAAAAAQLWPDDEYTQITGGES